MPVCLIDGPAGLSNDSKKELIGKLLDELVAAYQMDDDRVYIREYALTEVGHTPHDFKNNTWLIQSERARVVCTFIAPPGLEKSVKRKLFRNVSDLIAQVYQISDQRDILLFLNEHPIDNVASNGYIQTENPAFASPATMPK